MGTSWSCEEAFSGCVLGARPVPSGHAFITAAVPREGLNWCSTIMIGDDMVVISSTDAFAHNELLANHLASHLVVFRGLSALGSASSVEALEGSFLMSKDSLVRS